MDKRKVNRLKKGEIRVIKTDWEAIYELIRKTIMSNANQYFDFKTNRSTNTNQNVIFSFCWDAETEALIIYAQDLKRLKPISDKAENFLIKNMGITTDTFFKSLNNPKPIYKTVYFPDKGDLFTVWYRQISYLKRRKANGLVPGKLRIIKSNWKAVYELLCNTIIFDCEKLFDTKNNIHINFRFKWNEDTEEFIAYAYDAKKYIAIDLEKVEQYINKNINITTNSFFLESNDSMTQYKKLYLSDVYVEK